MNKNQVKNAILLINNFISILENVSESKEKKEQALKGIHTVVKSFGRNYDYADFMIVLGENKNNYADTNSISIRLAKDFVNRLKKYL